MNGEFGPIASASSVSWLVWAGLSAFFAALTAIFAKIGVADINSDFAKMLRTLVVVAILGLLLAVTGRFQSVRAIDGLTWLFLILSGLGTGASWLCYFRALKVGEAARVAPIDKLSVVLVDAVRRRVFRRTSFASGLDRNRAHRCWRGARRPRLNRQPA